MKSNSACHRPPLKKLPSGGPDRLQKVCRGYPDCLKRGPQRDLSSSNHQLGARGKRTWESNPEAEWGRYIPQSKAIGYGAAVREFVDVTVE